MDPVALQFGSLTIYWYGVLVALGFGIGLWDASRRGARAGLKPELFWDAGVWLVLGTIVGARALFVITFWDTRFAGQPLRQIFMVHDGGLVFYGGFIGTALAAVGYVSIKKIPLWKFADALAPGIALGYVPGRLGCVMSGCCYGRPTELPWAIHFPLTHETQGLGVHPTQLYDGLLSLVLYFALARLHRRKTFEGQVFAAYLIGYALSRSGVELFRGDYPSYYGGWATQAHFLSLGFLVLGLVLLRILPRPAKPLEKPETEVSHGQ